MSPPPAPLTPPRPPSLAAPPIPSLPPPLSAAAPGALYFIADLHLDPGPSARREAFIGLLSVLARPPRPAGLYIVGDLFEKWSGKGSMADPGHQPVVAAIRALAESGVPVIVFRGNRDFMLDGRFASRSRSTVVEEGLAISLGSRRAFLCHGDHLFPEDRLHQLTRPALRSALCRSLADALPVRVVNGITGWIRARSLSARRDKGAPAGREEAPGGPGTRRAPLRTSEIPARSAARIFRGGFDLLIAGHVHDERRHRLDIDGRTCELWTLGAWEERGSILEFAQGALEFKAWPFGADQSRKSEVGSRK